MASASRPSAAAAGRATPSCSGWPDLTTDALAVVATKCADAGRAREWRSTLARLVTDLGGSLWALVDPPPPGGPGPGHTHVAWIEGDRPEQRYREAVAAARAEGRLPLTHADIRTDRWIPHGARTTVADHGEVTGLIVAEVLCTDPGRSAEWDAWYDRDHLPDMLATGAFAAGRRWRRPEPTPGGADHLTVYEIAGMTVADAVARSAAAMPGIVAAGRKHPCHTGGATMALTRVTG